MSPTPKKRKKYLHYSRKEEVLASISLTGRVPSKKNSVDFAYKKGKPVYLGNPGYRRAKKGFMQQLSEQVGDATPLKGPLSMYVKFYGNREGWWKEWNRGAHIKKYTGADIDNKLASILDLLNDANVYHDDTQVVRGEVVKGFGKCEYLEDYGALIVICRYVNQEWEGGRFFRGFSE
jgi:Holliday junction resolvase RusA-like endonuclease